MKTKVFKNGNSMAVRIPSEIKIDCSTVEMVCDGDRIIIYPSDSDPWAEFKGLLKNPIPNFPERQKTPAQDRDWS